MLIPDNHNVKNVIESFRTQKTQKPPERVTKSTSTGKSEERKDEVVFSRRATEIKRIRELLTNLSDVPEEKIASLKAQINSGTYNIKGEEVAGKIIKESILNELL